MRGLLSPSIYWFVCLYQLRVTYIISLFLILQSEIFGFFFLPSFLSFFLSFFVLYIGITLLVFCLDTGNVSRLSLVYFQSTLWCFIFCSYFMILQDILALFHFPCTGVEISHFPRGLDGLLRSMIFRNAELGELIISRASFASSLSQR